MFTYLIHLGYLAYDEDSEQCYIPNREVRDQWILSVQQSPDYKGLMELVNASKELVESTIECDVSAVAEAVGTALNKAHEQICNNLIYNNEGTFQSVIGLAYFYANLKYTNTVSSEEFYITFVKKFFCHEKEKVQDYIKFDEINEHQVKATISAYGQTVNGIFNFNDEYEMTSFTTNDRAVVAPDGSIEYVPWSAVCGEYKVGVDGIKLPTKFQAVWNYKDCDFIYFDGKISRIAYE